MLDSSRFGNVEHHSYMPNRKRHSCISLYVVSCALAGSLTCSFFIVIRMQGLLPSGEISQVVFRH